MSSVVDICNLALSHLGDVATVSAITPPDGSAQADHCARFYPVARDQLLCMHAWAFATTRGRGAALDITGVPTVWRYAYARPNNCLNVISILPPVDGTLTLTSFPPDTSNYLYGQNARAGDLNTQSYIQELLEDGTPAIFTNQQDAIIRYTLKVTDTTRFSGLFVPALARLLATYLAGAVIKGTDGIKVAQAQYSAFLKADLPMATAMDQKNQSVNVYRDFVPDSLAARA